MKRSSASSSDEELRDAVIQRFEYTYELCWKMLKRRLEQEVPVPAEVDHYSFRELLREAAERGLIKNLESWVVYRDLRNITAHVYDDKKAQRVYQEIFKFFEDARLLWDELEKRNKN